ARHGDRRRQREHERRRQARSPRRQSGDRILFGKYAGQEITLDGEEYLIMKEDEVLAVIEGLAQQQRTDIKRTTQKKTMKTTTRESEAIVSKGTSMKQEQRKREPKKKR